ncbi:MAG: hypothetical protein ABWY50_09195 [Aeromicrobium sp.]
MRSMPRQLSPRWIRRHRSDVLAGASMVLGVIAILVGLVLRSGSDEPPSAAGASSGAGSTGRSQQVDTYVAPRKEGLGAGLAKLSPRSQQGISALAPPGGLAGEGGTKGLPKHSVVLRMTSAAPIGVVGYVVPTSVDRSSGTAEGVGTSWSLSTTAYGDPDYAQLFAQAGPRGVPITCTITIDGRVTERRSTDGPYGQLFCQG